MIHLIRATLRYASRKYWDQLAKDLRSIYTAPSVEAAWAAFGTGEMGQALPGDPEAVAGAWEEFTPFLAYDVEIAGSCSPPTRSLILSPLEGVVNVSSSMGWIDP